MDFLEPFVRRFANRIGWEIGDKIENAIWSLAIGLILLCCCLCMAAATVVKILQVSLSS